MSHPLRLTFAPDAEDAIPPETREPAESMPPESSLRRFDLSCARCGCHHVHLHVEFVKGYGEGALRLICGGCGLTEKFLQHPA